MSGILALLNVDGRPIDPRLLRSMTMSMRFRGPDAQDIWIDGHIGLGQTLLRTTWEAEHERQPCTVDGRSWIVADARIDDRAGLMSNLTARCTLKTAPTDPELILYAYQVWSTDCLDRLLGDFAFIIWDTQTRSLLAARDHFGVKPLFYGLTKGALIVSNTARCIRQHPDISDRLDDEAIADFLLFGMNNEPQKTSFAEVRRVPPAHSLTWSRTLTRRRYWTLPVHDLLRYRDRKEYVEHFDSLLHVAVADRMRCDRVAVSMSGGLDSTAVAASAVDLAFSSGRPVDVQAFTIVYDRLIPDNEREYAHAAAEGLVIQIRFLVADDYPLFERWEHFGTAEPASFPHWALVDDHLARVEEHGPVMLTGEGGDVMFGAPNLDLIHLLHNRKLWRPAARCSLQYLREGCLPRFGIRTRIRRWRDGEAAAFPEWLFPTLVEHLELRDRWRASLKDTCEWHPNRPDARKNLLRPGWQDLFERNDPGCTGRRVEPRYPLFDRRLVEFALRIPAVPWCVDKRLLRAAMRNRLPSIVRERPKTALRGDPVAAMLSSPATSWVDHFQPEPRLLRYVTPRKIPPIHGEKNLWRLWENIRPLCLNFWLASIQKGPNNGRSIQPAPQDVREAHIA